MTLHSSINTTQINNSGTKNLFSYLKKYVDDLYGDWKKGGRRGVRLSQPITRRQILDSSKLKDFADDNLKFEENDRKFFNFSNQ